MKKKSDKEKDLAALRAEFEKVENLFVTSYEKMRVSQDDALRKIVRESGSKYRVVKNNLAEKASEGTAAENVLKGLRGMTSIAYTYDDPVALAKALTTYAKANPVFTFKAGIVQGRVIDVKAIHELATLPSKEELYAKLMFLINSPAQRLAGTINAVGRSLAVVVDQAVKENKFQS